MTTLEDVNKTFKKWLFLSDDTIIDVILATYLTNAKEGTPVWIFIVDQSGETKTELLLPLLQFKNVLLLDDITISGITSGKENAQDLFSLINSGKTVIIIIDVATLSAKKKDDKNQIWAKFRNLFDGILSKVTGYTSKESLNAHVTLIGGATPNFRSQYIINNQLGSRELLYTPTKRTEDLQKKLDKAMENDNYEIQMRKELKEVIRNFMKGRKLKTFKWKKDSPETIRFNEFLNEQVSRLRITRATAEINYYLSAIVGEINIETPTRVKKQLKRLAEGLISLDEHYNFNRVKAIIRNVVKSSGNQLRQEIMDIFDKQPTKFFTIADISRLTKTHKKLVTIQLNFLWKLNWLNKKTHNDIVGGRTIEMHYYFKEKTEETYEPEL
jgi:hypothetical protein